MFDPRRVGRELERARRTYGGRNWPASFSDRLTSPLPSTADVARMLRQRGTPDLDVHVPVVAGARLPSVGPGQIAATWIGHATYAVQIGGKTVLTDPVWSTKIPGIRPRITLPGVAFHALPPIDAVVISHNHYDHLDAPTIRRIPRATPIYVPGMLGAWFRRRSFTNVVELDWWDTVRMGDVSLTFTPAHHWSRRGLFDTCKTLWGGWVMSDGDRCVYFAGDTGHGGYFSEIGARFPGLDMAILPIGTYQPDWFMRPNHLDPEEAVQACVEVGAGRMATMHWGTFLLSGEPILEPPARAAVAWNAAGRRSEDLFNLPVGGSAVI